MKKLFNALFDVPFDKMGLDPKTMTFGTLREVSYIKERIDCAYLRSRLLLLISGVLFSVLYFFIGLELNVMTSALLSLSIAIISYFGGFGIMSTKKYEHRLPLIFTLAGTGGIISVLLFMQRMPITSFYMSLLFLLSLVINMIISIHLMWSIIVSLIGILIYVAYFLSIFYSVTNFQTQSFAIIMMPSMVIIVSLFIIVSAYVRDYERRKSFYARKAPKSNSEKSKETLIKKVQNPVNKMFDSVMDVVFFITLEGDIKYVSKSIKEFLGYEPDELIGKRAIMLMSKAAHKQFESQTARLYQDLNLIQMTFDYKTKGSLIKKGEAIIKAYSDNKYGDGYIGSIRPLTDKKAKEIAEDVKNQHSLAEERDSLKLENKQLSLSVDDLKSKIDKLIVQTQMTKSMNIEDFADYLEGLSDFMSAYLVSTNLEHQHSLTDLYNLFESKRMGKYDLKQYIQFAKKSLTNEWQCVKLLDIYKSSMLFIIRNEPLLAEYTIKKSLEKSVVACASLFEGTEHIVDIRCASDLTAHMDIKALNILIKLMLSRSIYTAFDEVKNGKISINIVKENSKITLIYSDNGKHMTMMPFEAVFIESYFVEISDKWQQALGVQDILAIEYLKAEKITHSSDQNSYHIVLS